MGTFFGVPIIRIIVFWGLNWGPPILRNYHVEVSQDHESGVGVRGESLGLSSHQTLVASL